MLTHLWMRSTWENGLLLTFPRMIHSNSKKNKGREGKGKEGKNEREQEEEKKNGRKKGI